MTQEDVAFHHSFKPRWGPLDTLICAKNHTTNDAYFDGNPRWQYGAHVTSGGRGVNLLMANQAVEPGDMLDTQRHLSVIDRVDGIPFARLSKPDFQKFTELPVQSGQSIEEVLLWRLANILFNDDIEDEISAGVPPQLRSKFAHRIKKDRLSNLWQNVIRQKHARDLENINSPEERAIHLLCSHRIEEACKVLNQSRNLHLATLVAQIGRDNTMKSDMVNQIEVWQQNNVYSEMTEPIRALYELLAGNALRSEGKLGGALEDRASTFTFTERFDLDWFQAFGLRLWYGITEDEPIEAAVSKFLEDITKGQEAAFPHPPHRENERGVLQAGRDTVGRESPLWVLLKLYSSIAGGNSSIIPPLEFPASLLPESVSIDPLCNRQSFQLHQMLAATIGQNDSFKINTDRVDQLVWDFASELNSAERFYEALFVLLHLSRPVDRERAIKETLAHFGPQIPEPLNPDGTPDIFWHYLTVDLQIPEAWIWVAKALNAHDIGDAAGEVACLIYGKHWNDAHATFCRIVGPTAVIERDYTTLEHLVSGFGETPERRVRGWASGGGIYDDFLHLATAKGGKRDHHRLDRLVNALVAMEEKISNGSGVEGLEERVAFKEMSYAVAGWAAVDESNVSLLHKARFGAGLLTMKQAVESSTVLNLPLTGDARMIQTAEMSRRYYSVIMAGAY